MGEERKEGEWKGVEGEGGGRMEGRVEGSRGMGEEREEGEWKGAEGREKRGRRESGSEGRRERG